MPGLTGDVTSSSASVNTTITPNIVSNAKLAQVPAGTIKGNNTGSTANVTDLTSAQTKTMLSIDNVENTALSTWPGTSNLTTLGSVTTGTWNATSIAIAKGGTGASTAAGARANLLPLTGNAGKALIVNAGGTDAVAVAQYRKSRVIIITSSGTYTPTSGTTEFLVEGCAGGGGGAGAVGAPSSASVGGGGGAGGCGSTWVTTPAGSYSVTIGAAGAGGAGANGANGGDTTFGSVLLLQGGAGGSMLSAGTSIAFATQGTGGGATTGDILTQGSSGTQGIRLSGTAALGGNGGAGAYFGGSPAGISADANGNNIIGYGSGGAGAVAYTSTSRTGGAGAAGIIRIVEFITTTAP
jgi:hypothetical protein